MGTRAHRVSLGSLRQLSTQLSGSQVGITLTTLALGFVTTPAIASLLAGPLASVGVPAGARDRSPDPRPRAGHGVLDDLR